MTRSITSALLTALAFGVAACGGGGGGGGATTPDSTAGAAPELPLGNPTASELFPLDISVGMPFDGPAGGVSTASAGAAPAAEVQPGVPSTETIRAIAESTSVEAASELFSASFDSDLSSMRAPPAHAPCFAQPVLVINHDDLPEPFFAYGAGYPQTGVIGLRKDLETDGAPCALAQMRAQSRRLQDSAQQALLLHAFAGRMLAEAIRRQTYSGGSLTDIFNIVMSQHRPDAGGQALIPYAVRASRVAGDSPSFSFAANFMLVKNELSIPVMTIEHRSNGDGTVYAGIIRTLLPATVEASSGDACEDEIDTDGRYRLSFVQTLRYQRIGTQVRFGMRHGRYCGHPVVGFDLNANPIFDSVAPFSAAGELDPSIALPGGFLPRRDGARGWLRDFVRYAGSWYLPGAATSTRDHFVLAMPMNLPASYSLPTGTRDRSLIVALQSEDGGRTLRSYAGHGAAITESTGAIRGIVCNPSFGNNVPATEPRRNIWGEIVGHDIPLVNAFQSQVAARNTIADPWAVTDSRIRHAPTRNCDASAAMRFDIDGDRAILGNESGPFAHALDTRGAEVSIEDEMARRGFLIPPFF